MILHAFPASSVFFSKRHASRQARPSPSICAHEASKGSTPKEVAALPSLACAKKLCICGRRRFIEAAATSLFPLCHSAASDSSYDYTIADYKSQIFANLRGKAQKVLEIGIGGGPNLKYYAGDVGMQVYGMDPNRKMEKYAREAALNAGLPPENFEFKQAVGEAVPLPDASVDAVVGTLVLCSVGNVDMTLKEMKRVLRPGGLYVFVEHVAADV